ncbi:MAG: glycosyltransferase involved in cell wall biosynthesis, partial [Sphingobacteriales bacterium]
MTGLVVFRNEASNLPALLSSIQSVESGADNWIFVDDGSSDGGGELVKKAGFECVQSEGQGKNDGYRSAIGRLEHPWVWLIDADVTLGEEALVYLK